MLQKIQLTECPRDAMQGLTRFIPTEVKAAYINLLLGVGFDTVDFGSFVSPKAIPQMRDTADVLKMLDLRDTQTKLLAIVANYRGAEEAAQHEGITYLGYPFAISETFQLRNTNTTVADAFETVKRMKTLCSRKQKQLLVYLSMGFGNPYGDEWNKEIVARWAGKLVEEGIETIALSDTIGTSTEGQIMELYPFLSSHFPKTEFGLHLHSTPDTALNKIAAACQSGCRRFDSALKGFGGCPMAKDELTGNIATEKLVSYLLAQNVELGLDMDKLQEAMDYSVRIFG